MRREHVLDTQTGLPEVRATRDEEGYVRFRYATVRAGGMMVWEPIADETMRSLPGIDPQTFAEQVRAVQLDVARAIAARAAEHEADVVGLREQLEATQALLEEERRARAEAETTRNGTTQKRSAREAKKA